MWRNAKFWGLIIYIDISILEPIAKVHMERNRDFFRPAIRNQKNEQWRSVNSTRGVVRLVMQQGEKPRPIPQKIIQVIRNTED